MEKQLKIAVFIDFDNIEIGVKSLWSGILMSRLFSRRSRSAASVSKIAYGDVAHGRLHAAS